MPRVTAEHEHQQRQKILEAAMACFDRRGYYQTSVQDICDEAGLSKGGLYTYFTSKEQILAAVVKDNIVGGLDQAMAAARNGSTPLEKIDRVAAQVVERFTSDPPRAGHSPQLLLEIWAAASKNPRLRALCVEGYERWKQFIADLLREGQAHKQIKAGIDPQALAAALVAAFDGLSMQESLSRTKLDWPRVVQAFRQAVTEGVLTAEGIRAGQATPVS